MKRKQALRQRAWTARSPEPRDDPVLHPAREQGRHLLRRLGEVGGQVGPLLEESRHRPAEVADRGMLGGMALQVVARDLLESVVAEERGEARKVLAQHVEES